MKWQPIEFGEWFSIKNEKEKCNFQMCVETKARKRIEFAYSLLPPATHYYLLSVNRQMRRRICGILRTNKRRRGKAEQIATQMDKCCIVEIHWLVPAMSGVWLASRFFSLSLFLLTHLCLYFFRIKTKPISALSQWEKKTLFISTMHCTDARQLIAFVLYDSHRSSGRRDCIAIAWSWIVLYPLLELVPERNRKS